MSRWGFARELLSVGSLPPSVFWYAGRQAGSPLSPIAFGDELIAAPHQPVEVGIRAETSVDAHQGSLALLALFFEAQDALHLLHGPFEDLAGGGVARIKLLEDHFTVVGGAHPNQLPARGVAFS